MIPASIVIVTKDEERNIKDALESVKDFEEIIVVDAFSKDKTVEICKKYTEKVFQREWKGYAKQKQDAVDIAKGPWVLILDADERITRALVSEINCAISEDRYEGFFLPRKNFFLGKWIRHGGWWPDYTLRLFKKSAGSIEERAVHEKVVVQGSISYLRNPIEHYTYDSIADYIKKMDGYSALASEELRKSGTSANLLDLIFRPLLTFIKMLVIRRGFMDGMHGLILAVLYSYYTFLKYAKTWETKY
ncbi:MAG: glycosyltransferase family 2 protein [Nitrospirae bacterium]|nr:glycosyltransferase family 2 protein [Nitrospirota bacterium]